MRADDERLGERFQRETSYSRGALGGWQLDWARRPGGHKDYPDAPHLELPEPERDDGPGLWSLLRRRRSVRRYAEAGISAAELGQVLWAADGMTRDAGEIVLRTAPSAGGLYPVETYVAVHDVSGVEPGVWHYDVRRHRLDQVAAGDVRVATARAALDQPIAATAAAVFIWTAVFERTLWKYRQRGFRYMYMEAGHLAQNAALAAVALGLGSCQIAAIYDDEANTLVDADGTTESVLYMSTLARGAPGT
jgi:SagB-type dehydrogenase family enzyme